MADLMMIDGKMLKT